MMNLIEALTCTEDGPLKDGLSAKATYFIIIWVKQGQGAMLIDVERFPVKANTTFLVTPGQMYLLQPAGRLEGYCMHFPCDMVSRLGQFSEFIPPAYAHFIEMEGMLRLIMDEYNRCSVTGASVPEELTEVLFIYLMRMHPARTKGLPFADTTSLAGRFLRLLREDTTTRKHASDFADALAITPNHLNQIVKQACGSNVKYIIQQHLLLEAKRRILHCGFSAKQAAYCLGFEDTAHFSKFFKRCAGMTFNEFRRSIQKQIP